MQYAHGGDVYSYRIRFGGREPLDFSANINPRGIPQTVKSAMHQAVDNCTRYPDPQCRALKAALGARWNLPPEAFFCGNGAAEIFYRLVHCIKPRTALLTAPTFGEYEQALCEQGTEIRFHKLLAEEGFGFTSRFLLSLTPDLDMVILCTPNNPTGCTVPRALMQQILERCQANNTWLVIDECFQDFLTEPFSMRADLETYSRLVVVRAFTKMYAVPGVRLGWCMTNDFALIDRLHTAGQPWNVSVIAEACGIAALSCTDWEQQTAETIKKQRMWLTERLRDMGFTVFEAQANYILFYTERFDLRERLMPHGILIRSCENYRGLGKGYFRVAVRGQPDNQILIHKMQEVITDGKGDYGTGHGIECRKECDCSCPMPHF